MNKKLRAFLEANGLRADATEKEAWAHYDTLKEDGIELPGINPGERSAAEGGPAPAGSGEPENNQPAAEREGSQPTPQRTYSQADLHAAAAAAVTADNSRRAEVQDMIDVAGVGDLDSGNFARTLLNDPGMTAERASRSILAELKKNNRALGGGAFSGASVGTEAPEKLRAAITDGLLLRSGIAVEKPAAGAREFRGRSLLEICRENLTMNGVNCRSLSRMEIAGRAVAAGSTSDFPSIFSSLVNRNLLKAYMEWPATFRSFVAVGDATDFRDIHAIKLSGAPDLKGLSANGEYQTAKFSDSGEKYRVVTKGIRVPLTRTMIINDDLRAFTRIPQLFGVAAKRMESDAVYSLITTNPVMADGNALFSSAHKNLAGTGGPLGSDTLGAARTAMRKQQGMAGEMIDVQPAFLLTPVVMETDAEVLLRSTALPDDNKSAGVHNPWAGKLTPIADPHLDAASASAWYLLAHPNQAAVIEVAWLEGEEQPYVEEMVDFNSDALVVKVRHDFGAGTIDHIGGYKNAGE
jgi:hypothetical protein